MSQPAPSEAELQLELERQQHSVLIGLAISFIPRDRLQTFLDRRELIVDAFRAQRLERARLNDQQRAKEER